MTEWITCPWCNGTGHVLDRSTNPPSIRPCAQCRGMGKIEKL